MSQVAEASPTIVPPVAEPSSVQRARALTGSDGRGLYEALIDKLFDNEAHRFAYVSSRDEYERHLPTSLQVEEDLGWPILYRLSRWTENAGWEFFQLRDVWTYSNTAESGRRLRVSRAPKWPRVINAPWLDAPRTVSDQTR